MHIRLRDLLVPALCGLVAVTACTPKPAGEGGEAGTESGNGDGDPGDGDGDAETNFGACGEETETVLVDLDQIPAGWASSISDTLDAMAGSYSGTFTWFPADGPWTVVHAGTESPMTAALAYAGGEVRLVEVELDGEFPEGQLGGEPCSNYIVAQMQFELDTEDGLFAESLSVPMTLPGPEAESDPSLHYTLDFATHMGTLAADDFVTDEGMISAIVLDASFGATDMLGGLGMEVMVGDGPDGIVGFGFIAEFTGTRDP